MQATERTNGLITEILALLREVNYEVHRQEEVIENLRAEVNRNAAEGFNPGRETSAAAA